MEYKGYCGTVEFSKEDQVFFGKVKSISCLVSYESDTSEGLFQAFQEAVDDYLACSIILKELKYKMEHKELYNKTIELIKVMYDSGFVFDKINFWDDNEIYFKHTNEESLSVKIRPYNDFIEDMATNLVTNLVKKKGK